MQCSRGDMSVRIVDLVEIILHQSPRRYYKSTEAKEFYPVSDKTLIAHQDMSPDLFKMTETSKDTIQNF